MAFLAKAYGDEEATAIVATLKKAYPQKKIQTLSYMCSGSFGLNGLSMRNNVVKMARLKHDLNAAPAYAYYFTWQTPILDGLPGDGRQLEVPAVQVNVDEADVGKVKVGQHVQFTVDAYPGRQFPGTITEVRYNSTTTNNVVTYLAEISVNNDELLLRPGMTATANITVQSIQNALLVSNHALRFLPSNDEQSGGGGFLLRPPDGNRSANADSTAAMNNPHVWVVRDGRPFPIAVRLGATDGKSTEIRSGQVTPGTPLIVEALKEKR